jgi:hypothetical protein
MMSHIYELYWHFTMNIIMAHTLFTFISVEILRSVIYMKIFPEVILDLAQHQSSMMYCPSSQVSTMIIC